MIKLADPKISKKSIEVVKKILESGNLVQGKYVEKFERKEKKPGDSYAKTKITYKPKITYSYRVEEKEYTGDRIDFSNLSYSDLQKAKEVLQTYTIGREIEIGMLVVEIR